MVVYHNYPLGVYEIILRIQNTNWYINLYTIQIKTTLFSCEVLVCMIAKNQAIPFKSLKQTSRRFSIINFVQDFVVLSRRQISQLAFVDSNYGLWICRVELKKLFDAGLIQRGRCMSTNDYVYWCGKQPKQIEHMLGISEVCLIVREKAVFKREYDFGIGVADVFITVENRPYFVEYQRSINHSDMSVKLKQYEQYALSRRWDTEEWPMPGRFARVVVVVDNLKDKERIEKIIKNSSIKIIACLMSDVKEVIV